MRITVRSCGPLRGAARVPGDKSISHRAVLLGAVAHGVSRVRGVAAGDDVARTVAAVRALGVRVDEDDAGLAVRGAGLDALRASPAAIDCGNSGTTMRLGCGLCAALPFATVLDGDASLRRRPMRRVADPLARMGARVAGHAEGGELRPPLRVRGGALRGCDHDLPVASAQVKSAILLAALAAEGATRVREPARSRDHGERMLRAMGAPLTARAGEVVLDPSGWDRRLRPVDLTVPGDLSSAAFLIAAAAMRPGSDVTVEGVLLNPTRAGVLDALAAMGADLAVERTGEQAGEPVGRVRARGARLGGARIDGELALRALDELPLLAAVAACADGETVIAGAAELRVKESDRIAAMAAALARMGVDVAERPDGWVVRESRPRGAHFSREDVGLDHRVAMSLAVLGFSADGETVIDGADTIASSFPEFPAAMAALGASLTVR